MRWRLRFKGANREPIYLGVVVFGALAIGACQNTDITTGPTDKPPPPLVFDTAPEITEKLRVVVDRPGSMFIEHPPALIAGGDESFAYSDSIQLDLGSGGRFVREIFVFHGVDRGDVVEMETHIVFDGNPAFARSDHGIVNFDAWKAKVVNTRARIVTISVGCRVTGVNENLNRLAARAHWGIWVVLE